jgi:membrane protein required for beta-lactamase induction
MNLISILIALVAATYFYKSIQEWRQFDWFYRYTDRVYERLAGMPWRDGAFGVIIILGSVVAGVWLVDAMLDNVAGVFGFLFGIVVLIFSLGPRDLADDVEHFVAAIARDDGEAACIYATNMLGFEVAENESEAAQHVKEGILVQANIRQFGVLLWFMLLGPVGAALFRLACELRSHLTTVDSGFAASVNDLYRILIWLPARLMVFAFAVAGSFVDTVTHLKSFSDIWRVNSEALLVEAGLGAIFHEPHGRLEDGSPDLEGVAQVMALVKRTLLVWLAVLAMLTLAGWVF